MIKYWWHCHIMPKAHRNHYHLCKNDYTGLVGIEEERNKTICSHVYAEEPKGRYNRTTCFQSGASAERSRVGLGAYMIALVLAVAVSCSVVAD